MAAAGLGGSASGAAGQDRPLAGDLAEVSRVGGTHAPEWEFDEMDVPIIVVRRLGAEVR